MAASRPRLASNLGRRLGTMSDESRPAVALAMPSYSRTKTQSPVFLLCPTTQTRKTSSGSRAIHSSSNRENAALLATGFPSIVPATTASPSASTTSALVSSEGPSSEMPKAPLSVLPLTTVLRSLATTTISSSPTLLRPSMAIMAVLAHTTNPLLMPDRNPVLRYVLKKTFYAQFCAGENAAEVRETIRRLKDIGFTGVILGYAREVVLSEAQARDLSSCSEGAAAAECVRDEIVPWAQGTLETVRLAAPGDFVSIKFTGAGRQALYSLSRRLPPPPALREAIDSICALAAERGIRLLFDAEQQAVQDGIDDWTLEYMRRHNAAAPGRAVVYGTYQAYLKSTPAALRRHLDLARDGRFTLGVKLVRGAYIGSDPRHLIHDTKADTDAAYDGVAAALLRRRWGGADERRAPAGGCPPFPDVSLVLASHNARSVRRARAIRAAGETRTETAYGQLQGMADEISCELVQAGREARAAAAARTGADGAAAEVDVPRAYKYLVWGSTGECMKYLLRRAQENKDAVGRTRAGRDAMRAEVWRRFKAVFGLA